MNCSDLYQSNSGLRTALTYSNRVQNRICRLCFPVTFEICQLSDRADTPDGSELLADTGYKRNLSGILSDDRLRQLKHPARNIHNSSGGFCILDTRRQSSFNHLFQAPPSSEVHRQRHYAVPEDRSHHRNGLCLRAGRCMPSDPDSEPSRRQHLSAWSF